jgi:rSAM/selenodomain-associated transferase 1
MTERPAGGRRLIIMTREPRLGAVKTRLAAEIGAVEATRFYRSVTLTLIRRLAFDRRWKTVLAVAPDTACMSRSWPAGVQRVVQGGGDIGARMGRLMRSQSGAALLIGSDIPEVEASHIAQAFMLLHRNDAVFGPAEDGGFWLVGLKPLPHLPNIFRDVRWSSPDALSDTLANLAGRKVGFATKLADVDDQEAYWRTGASAIRVTQRKADPAYSSS